MRLTDFEFDKHVTTVKAFFLAHAQEYGFDMKWFSDVFMPRYMKWVEKYTASLNDDVHAKSITFAKNQAREELEPVFSVMVTMVKINPMVSDEQRVSLGIAIGKGGGGHALPAPDDFPEIWADMTVLRWLKMRFRRAGSKTWGRPIHIQGMELVGGIYAEEPKNVEDMLQSWFSTKSPLAIGFREEDRGKWFYFCVRWESTAGLKGPWSPIMKVMIP